MSDRSPPDGCVTPGGLFETSLPEFPHQGNGKFLLLFWCKLMYVNHSEHWHIVSSYSVFAINIINLELEIYWQVCGEYPKGNSEPLEYFKGSLQGDIFVLAIGFRVFSSGRPGKKEWRRCPHRAFREGSEWETALRDVQEGESAELGSWFSVEIVGETLPGETINNLQRKNTPTRQFFIAANIALE